MHRFQADQVYPDSSHVKVGRGYTKASFGQIHYRRAGPPGRPGWWDGSSGPGPPSGSGRPDGSSGPTLVLLHQTPSTSAMYEDLMRTLASDFRLLAPDTPGMGLSDPVQGRMTIDSLANGIVEFLDALGIESCFVFGHHTGAAIATQLAADYPARVDALALSGPTLIDATLRAKLVEASAVAPPDDDGGHLVRRWHRIRQADKDVPLEIAQRETLNAIALGDRYAAAYEAVMAHDVAAALAALTCPVLVFAGTRDVLYPRLDDALGLLARGSKREVADAGTFICETHCSEVAALLREFLAAEAA